MLILNSIDKELLTKANAFRVRFLSVWNGLHTRPLFFDHDSVLFSVITFYHQKQRYTKSDKTSSLCLRVETPPELIAKELYCKCLPELIAKELYCKCFIFRFE